MYKVIAGIIIMLFALSIDSSTPAGIMIMIGFGAGAVLAFAGLLSVRRKGR